MAFEWRSKIKFKSNTISIILIARPVAGGGAVAAALPCRPAEPSKIVEKVTKKYLIFQKIACGGHFDTHKLDTHNLQFQTPVQLATYVITVALATGK